VIVLLRIFQSVPVKEFGNPLRMDQVIDMSRCNGCITFLED